MDSCCSCATLSNAVKAFFFASFARNTCLNFAANALSSSGTTNAASFSFCFAYNATSFSLCSAGVSIVRNRVLGLEWGYLGLKNEVEGGRGLLVSAWLT
jgi:hypothetical protein